MKKVAILGSTGSIGVIACDVIKIHSQDFKITALSANQNYKLLAEQANFFKPSVVCVGSKELISPLKGLLNYDPQIFFGEQGLVDTVKNSDAKLLLNSLVGAVGLVPTLEALNLSLDVALANKETLVVGGQLVTSLAEKKGAKIIPVDSEHNAIFQSLMGNSERPLKKITLTASGGPLLNFPVEKFDEVTIEQALNHPTWGMGRKISIDSATMMNKGLEIIEARWLFNLPTEKIDVVIHPQSIVHGMAEFSDGSVLAVLGPTSMSVPIIYSLYYPQHSMRAPAGSLDFSSGIKLEFFAPDEKRFPLLKTAKEVSRKLGTLPAVFNASNEIAVQAFLDGKIKFTEIRKIIEDTLSKHNSQNGNNLEVLLDADAWARKQAKEFIKTREA